MEFEQLFTNFKYDDLQWFIPVLAGLVIILGGLLIGMIRGMTAGVIVALFFGGLMSLSPVLLETLQREAYGSQPGSAALARSVAELAELNNQATMDLSRVVATMRVALEGLSPAAAAADGGGEGVDGGPADAASYTQALSDLGDRLDAAVETLSRAGEVRQRVSNELQSYDAGLRRGPGMR